MQTLSTLKEEKLKIARWRESTQVTSQVKTIIIDQLQWLPQQAYQDDEVSEKADVVYQYIFANHTASNAVSSFLGDSV